MTETHNETLSPLLISAEEVAKLLQLSIRSVWRLRTSGRMPKPIRIGGAIRWRLLDIESWIAQGCPAAPGRENTTRK